MKKKHFINYIIKKGCETVGTLVRAEKNRQKAYLVETVCHSSGSMRHYSITSILSSECKNKPIEICGTMWKFLIVAGHLIQPLTIFYREDRNINVIGA